ncbi:MAG: type II secretion system protein [Succinivibrionaceae bacterium]|nr:type II secretion system protein [Succinivibrionaceae bacterium]
MKKNSGFTLIELVVVIVILGILAATAAPKFMDLQKDARISALNGLMGAMKSASSMVYSKAILAGQDTADEGDDVYICSNSESCAEIPSNQIKLKYGHPTADGYGIVRALQDDIGAFGTATDGDWVYKFYLATAKEPKYILVLPATFNGANANATPQECYVKYTAPDSKDGAPKFELVKTGC